MSSRSKPKKSKGSRRRGSAQQPAWLLLVHQLPSRPSNVRVRTWRRLQDVGALSVKNSVYVLPNSKQAQEDLEWIKSEVVAMKGQATVFAADSVDSLSDGEIISTFRRTRQKDYDEVHGEARNLLTKTGRKRPISSPVRRHLAHRAQLLRKQWDRIASIDFFGAPSREEALAALRNLEELLTKQGPALEEPSAKGKTLKPRTFRNQLWITRPRPGIDRMASAWFIRHFIDPGAKFGFVERADDMPSAIPFDMFGVDFSHQGNNCTFETLADRFGLQQSSLKWLEQIVHNLDLKDNKYVVPEAPAIGLLVDGLQQMFSDDLELLERGITLFEALHRSSAAERSPTRKPSKATPRRRRKVSRKQRET